MEYGNAGELSDKLLVIILAGRNDLDRARQGLAFAKNARKLGLMADVQVLFFGPGVQLLDPGDSNYRELEASLKEFGQLKVGVAACVSNIGKYGLTEKLDRTLVVAEEAAFLISDHVKKGYQTVSF